MNRTDEPEISGKRRPSWRVIALFVLSQIVGVAVIAELGTHLLDPRGISYFPETARLLDAMIHEEPIGCRSGTRAATTGSMFRSSRWG